VNAETMFTWVMLNRSLTLTLHRLQVKNVIFYYNCVTCRHYFLIFANGKITQI
jgi:hypothetical protein